MDQGLVWILVGLGLFAAELLIPGVFLLWIGIAAIGSGLVLMAWPEMPFSLTVIMFISILSAGIFIGLRLRRISGDKPQVNLPGSAVVGRIGMVTDANGPLLRIRLGDSDWSGQSEDPVTAGEQVEVIDVVGTQLRVRRPRPSPSVTASGA